MSLEEDILIERFLKNELSETENNDVLERIGSDALFREKILFEQQLFETLDENNWSFAKNTDPSEAKDFENLFKSNEIKNIKKSIAKANEKFKKKKSSTFKKWPLYSSAAVIALLISVYLFNPKNQTSEEIYLSYITTTGLPSIINRGEENKFAQLFQAQRYFENKEYSSAINLLSEEFKNYSNNSNIYLYLAISQMELNQFQEAEKTLDSLINSNLIDAEKGYWFKSLLFLKSKKIQKAKATLSIIIKNNYFNSKKSEILLKEITD